MPDDIITPQDSLEPVNQAAAPAAPAPSVSGPVPAGPLPDDPSPAPSYLSGLVANKLLRRFGLSSVALIVVIGLLVGATIIYQKTQKVQLTQSQQVAQIKDQSVSLRNQLPNDANKAQLRQGVNTLYVNGDLSAQGQLNLSNGSAQAQLSSSALTNTQNYLLPNASGTICLSSNNCNFATRNQVAQIIQSQGAGATGVSSLQGTAGQVLVSGAGGHLTLALPQNIAPTSSPTFQNLKINGSVTQNGSLVCDASNNCGFASVNSTLLQGGNQFGTTLALGTLDGNAVNLLSDGAVVASFSAGGQANFQNSSDSTTGFRVQNAGGDSLFTIDTANNQVILGSSSSVPTVLTLGVSTTSSDPAGSDGQMYYNAALGKFRCYENGTWTNCVGGSGAGTGDVNNGGNNYGYIMSLGTLDNYPLLFMVNGQFVGGFVTDLGGGFALQNYQNSDGALLVNNSSTQTVLTLSTLTNNLTLAGGVNVGMGGDWLRLTQTSQSATMPNATTNQLTGDIEITARIAPAMGCDSAGIVAYKSNSYGLFVSQCKLAFVYSQDGSTVSSVISTVVMPYSSGKPRWVRVTFKASTGEVNFYTHSDQASVPDDWGQLGSSLYVPVGSIYPSSNLVQVGGNYLGSISQVNVLDGIGGTPVVFFDAADIPSNYSSWTTYKDQISNTWTLVGNAKKIGNDSYFDGKVSIGTYGSVANGLLNVGTLTTSVEASTTQVAIATDDPANQALVLQAASSQTADLFQNQTSGGIAVSGFGANGSLYSNGLTTNLNALVSPSLYCYGFGCSSVSTTGGTLAAGTYYYTVTSVNANGTEAVPAATTKMTATTSTSSVNLLWAPSTGAIKYNIYRSTSSTFNSPSLLATVTTNGYLDTGNSVTSGAPPSSTSGSSLNVRAWDGQSSGALQVQSANGITLSGISATGGLFTNGASSTFSALKSPVITALSPGYGIFGGNLPIDTYYYAVTAVNALGETTVDQATNSFTTAQNNASIKMTWTAVPGATSYRIYRSSASTGGAEFGPNSLLTTVDGLTTAFTDYGNGLSAGRPNTSTTGSGLTLQGWDGQTSDILQLQNSNGSTLSSFANNGSLTISGGATVNQKVAAVSLDGLTNSFSVSTPDATANRVTGSIMVTAQVALKSWANGSTYQTIASKYDGSAANSAWLFRVSPTGYLNLRYSVGGTITQVQSTVPVSAADGSTMYVRFSRNPTTGDITFYSSSDGTIQVLGSVLSGPAGALNAGSAPVQIGSYYPGNDPMRGTVTRVYINTGGVNSPVVLDMYPAMASSVAATSWVSSTTGETWTLSGTARLVKGNAQLTIASNDSSTSGIVLQAASNQSASMLQINSNAGGLLFSVSGDGSLSALGRQNGIGGYGTSGVVLTVSSGANYVDLVVRGSASQSVDLQQWQDFNSNVLASVSATGQGSFSNLLQNGNQVCDDSNNCNFLSGDTSSYLQNGVIYFDGTDLVSTAAGSTGQCLSTVAGTPTWVACGAGGSGTGDVNNGGNFYGSTMSLGTTDNFGLNFITNNHIVAQFSNSGQVILQNTADSATAFQIQNAAGTSLFTADTANSVIYIGNPTADSTGTLLVLDNKNTSGDPAGINGAMYYNSALGKFRCYEDNAWRNCIDSLQAVSKASNQNFTSASYTNIDNLSFAVVGGNNYRLACQLLMTVPAGAGAYLSTSAPGGNFTASFIKTGDQTAGDNYATSTVLEDPSPTSISRITSQTGTRFLLNYNALLTGVTSTGVWQLVLKTASGTVTVGANSSCTLQPL